MNPNHPRVAVTGSASGIGAAIARRLGAEQINVIGLDLHDAEIEVDLGSPTSIESAIDQLRQRGPLDGLVNVAGRHPHQDADADIVRVNFLGTRRLTEGLRTQLEPGSSVITIGSSTGWRWRDRTGLHGQLIATKSVSEENEWLESNPIPEGLGYARSKELLAQWTRTLAATWLPNGIRVNLIAPGPVATEAFLAFRRRVGDIPLDDVDRVGRPGTPDEVADAAAYLLSDQARWINGIELALDGGLTASFLQNPPADDH